MLLSQYPRLKLALEAMGIDNGADVRDEEMDLPVEWCICVHMAELELSELSNEEIETLVMGERTEAESLIERAPNANKFLDAAFDGELSDLIYCPWADIYDARFAENRYYGRSDD